MLALNTIESITLQDRQRLARIETHDMSFVQERLVEHSGWTSGRADAAIGELRKFLSLAVLTNGPLAMIGETVDEAWHQFILFTDQYREFCDRVIGKFVSHTPNTRSTPVPIEAAINFVQNYKLYFGDLDGIWYDDPWPGLRAWVANPTEAADTPKRWSGWLGERRV